MSSHPYEYKMLVEYLTPEQPGLDPHFSHLEDQEGLTASLEEVIEHLPGSVPEGWEVVSHDVTTSRSTVILTVLLRRERGLATVPDAVS
jgi:hypothetical protein